MIPASSPLRDSSCLPACLLPRLRVGPAAGRGPWPWELWGASKRTSYSWARPDMAHHHQCPASATCRIEYGTTDELEAAGGMAAAAAPLRMRPTLRLRNFWVAGLAAAFCIVLATSSSSLFRQQRQQLLLLPAPLQGQVRRGCDYGVGNWVPDASRRPAYDHTCPDIFKGWNCAARKKWNAHSLLRWRWSPTGCHLPQLDPRLFLERFRNRSIGFVGDSLNRNMYISLACSLRGAARKAVKVRPGGADRGLIFPAFNLTIAYHRTILLARYGRWEASGNGTLEELGFKRGYRVDVDVPQGSWAEAPLLHNVLILNTGHWWWAPDKFHPVNSPLLFFRGGEPILPPMAPEEGLDLVLRNMIAFVDDNMPCGFKFFRTQSPRHFSGGDWNNGGSCRSHQPLLSSQVERFFATSANTEARLANQHVVTAVLGTSFVLLDVTPMSEYRADAHPAQSGGKLHEDCLHWCLPGLPDIWNDMLAAHLLDLLPTGKIHR